MKPISLYTRQPGDEARHRRFIRQTFTTILLVVLGVMIVLDVFIYRRRAGPG